MTESLGFRESMKEADIKSKLDKTEKAYWDNLPISEKRQFIELYKHDKNNCISVITSKVKEIDPTHENAFVKAKNDKMIKFFKTQGIDEPTETTKKAFDKQSIFANFDNFYHAMGQFTFNMEKQAKYNYYMSQQKQNFIQIAQLDTLIKQYNNLLDQNHKILQQNDEIINLLKQISNK